MTKMQTVLVTGGAGYIGSHISLALLEAGYKVVVFDNLANSSSQSIVRVSKLSSGSITFVNGDVREQSKIYDTLTEFNVTAVIHCAGLKSTKESVESPLFYYSNNVAGTISLCSAMVSAGVFNLVFSSSATVYGNPSSFPVNEDQESDRAATPYGRSKRMVEQIFYDLARSDDRWLISILRYFNPVGAHESGLIGEDPKGVPSNLIPYIARVAAGSLPELKIYGADYDTPDGTGVRDYIHVMDLAEGHLLALEALRIHNGFNLWNLGTGIGYSVMEVIRMFEKISGRHIPFKIVERRPGDIASCFADCSKAKVELGWVANRNLQEMLRDTWRWQLANPDGYTEL